jgi:hypothetical protein
MKLRFMVGALLFACGPVEETPALDAGVIADSDVVIEDAGIEMDAGFEDASIAPVSFAEVRSRVLSNCSPATCHGFGREGNGFLEIQSLLDDDDLYAELVGVASSTVIPNRAQPNVPVRVVPFEPRQSFLLWKLEGHDPDDPSIPVVGRNMPPRDDFFSRAELDLVRAWIDQGAPLE